MVHTVGTICLFVEVVSWLNEMRRLTRNHKHSRQRVKAVRGKNLSPFSMHFCPSKTLEAERSLLQVSNHDALLCALQLPPRSEPLQYRVLPLVLGAVFHLKMPR
jgi:hypothetical protein